MRVVDADFGIAPFEYAVFRRVAIETKISDA